jgi:hypothetical protein
MHIAPWHWEGAELQIGALVFNILNHPNFDQPVGDVPNPQFGYSIRTVATPTSILRFVPGRGRFTARASDSSPTPLLTKPMSDHQLRPGFPSGPHFCLSLIAPLSLQRTMQIDMVLRFQSQSPLPSKEQACFAIASSHSF